MKCNLQQAFAAFCTLARVKLITGERVSTAEIKIKIAQKFLTTSIRNTQ